MPTSSLQQDNLPNPVVSLQLRKVKKHVMVNYIMWDSFKMHWKKNSERGKIAIYGSPINCFKMVFWLFFYILQISSFDNQHKGWDGSSTGEAGGPEFNPQNLH